MSLIMLQLNGAKGARNTWLETQLRSPEHNYDCLRYMRCGVEITSEDRKGRTASKSLSWLTG